jgi:sugar-specific transcriptional regulator TrmB
MVYTLCMIRNTKQIFKILGMSKHANEIYETIQKNGPILASHIIAQSKVYRPAAYKALFELLDAGLVTRIKSGKRLLWRSMSSKRILDLLVKDIDHAQKLLPKEKDVASNLSSSSMKVQKGRSAIRGVFDDVIEHTKPGGTFYRYTSEKDLASVNSYLSPAYRKKRAAKRLERLVISNPVSGQQKQPRLERFIKYIGPETDIFAQNIIQLVYGDRVAFIDLNTEETWIIENPALAEFQKVIFRQLYKKL